MENRTNDQCEPLSFASLALALAGDYKSLYVIDPEDDSYVEYAPSGTKKELISISSGDDFFQDVPKNCREQVFKDDQDYFMNAFRKDHVIKALRDGQSFTLTYRLIVEGQPRYFFLKTIRACDRRIIIGVQDVDDQKRRELEAEQKSHTYSEIADSLASLFEIIFHIDVETGTYSVYSVKDSFLRLKLCGQKDFFESVKIDIERFLHPDDRERILHELERDVLLANLHAVGTVSLTYRHMMDGEPLYMNLLAFFQNNQHIVVGIRNVNAQKRQETESLTYSRIAGALASRYEVIYHVNILTNEYTEYSTSSKYARLKTGTRVKDFFADSRVNAQRDIYPEDLPMMLSALHKEKLLESLSECGKLFLSYRQMIDGRAQYMSLYAVRPKEDSEHIILAVANVDTVKRMELAYQSAMDMANKDALTGVKNKRAYVQTESDLDELIQNSDQPPFSIVVCDVNGLKHVNDTKGHKAGDEYIRSACSMICNTFKHSPVFRIGGDEFAVVLKGSDYQQRSCLIQQLEKLLEANKQEEIALLAFGISDFDVDRDMRVQDVFERADTLMYEQKELCKYSRS
ncbi:MAG: GGDEF domain-containing protein [Oscillospiraceae bacterium]|nr:GGDEF domain-containing protein [Oscillospiraceae bacterium]